MPQIIFTIEANKPYINEDPQQNELDKELIDNYQKSGNSFFVGELFDRYTHLIFAVCLKYLQNEADSKDAVMDIFEKLLVELKTRSIDNFKNWIYTLTKNHCLQHLRTHNNRHRIREKMGKESLDNGIVKPDENLLKEEVESQYKHLQEAISELKDEQEVCIRLMYLEEKTYKEIADDTGFEIKKVKSYIQNGKRNLKTILEKKNVFGA